MGAGASWAYGFPVGNGLKKKICSILRPEDLVGQESRRKELEAVGFSVSEIDEFRGKLARAGDGSIDEFLEHNPELIRIGKASIGAALIPLENEEVLFERAEPSDDWYPLLFQRMKRGIVEPANFGPENRLSVINFNYDRSFEHFFYMSFMSSLKMDVHQSAIQMKHIPVLHPYGCLAPHPCIALGRAYEPRLDSTSIKQCIDGIRVFHEKGEDEVFAQAQEMLVAADQVVILGFAFHLVNINRRRLMDCKKKQIASAFQMSELEKEWVRKTCANGIELGPRHLTVLPFLKELVSFD